MDQVKLANNGRVTTRLGYGCSSIMGALNRRQSLRLLEAAYDAGIRHFDVAPMYGYGEAESCVGEFLAGHRNDVTVTTKYGIAPPKRGGLLRAARRVVGPVVQKVPALKKRLARAAGAVAAPAERSRFSADEARVSLENSLRALRTGFIDIWLLHEAEASDLGDDALLRFIQDMVAQGKIGSFGVGSDSSKIPALLRGKPEYCPVVQHDWSVLDAAEHSTRGFHIHHRALTDRLSTVHADLTTDAAKVRRWSDAVGRDLSNREVLASLMLKAALVLHPNTVLLVSSKNSSHISDNVRVADDAGLEEPARRLYERVQREGLASAANPLRRESR
ncbi:MAG TPA: aldo/keto reductase [Acidobacteriaceae bacterium]|nr:aldo/keto reductase [Acidobacteriaceae bacterium]